MGYPRGVDDSDGKESAAHSREDFRMIGFPKHRLISILWLYQRSDSIDGSNQSCISKTVDDTLVQYHRLLL